MLCPRAQAVPKNTVGTPSVLSGLRSIVGAQAHGQCASLLSVLRPLVGTHRPLSVLKPIAGTQSAWSVSRRIVSAPAHGQCPGPSSVFRPIVSARRMVSVPAHGRYPGRKTEDRRPAPRSTRPNKAVELTGKKLAPFPSSSPLALGFARRRRKR